MIRYGITCQDQDDSEPQVKQNGKEANKTSGEKPISTSSSVFSLSKIKQQTDRAQIDSCGDRIDDFDSESCGEGTSQVGSKLELRPLSPIMASLCLDDVDLFARLYKHHQTLFNYFKPDEDYELIYYAIKFQSKSCLIYLLSNMSNESFPTLFEQANNPSIRFTLPGGIRKFTSSINLPNSNFEKKKFF